MPRIISPSFRRSLEEPRSADYPIVLLEITHPSLTQPIRVANDIVSYIFEGDTYIGFPFEFEIVGDTDQVPRGQLRIQNVDRRLSEAILELTSPPRVDLLIFASSDFSDTLVDGCRTYLEDPAEGFAADDPSQFMITSGVYINHFKYLGSGSGINNYFVFAGMALEQSHQYTSEEILNAVATALKFCVVPRRADLSTYDTFGQLCVFSSGNVFLVNVPGTTAATEPSDAGVTGGQSLGDGGLTWESTGIQVPVNWSEFLIDVGPSLTPLFVGSPGSAGLVTPDSNDAYVGILLAAAVKGKPSAAWLNAASGIPGYTRIQLFAKLALENISGELNAISQLPNTFQGAVNAAGAPFDVQYLADGTEAGWTGMRALAALHTIVGDYAAATAASNLADAIKPRLLGLRDPVSGRFRTFYGQTGFEALTGDAAFISDLRFHLWPTIHGMLLPSEMATYRDSVIAYTEANTPNLYNSLVNDFVMSEWYWGVGRSTHSSANPARVELIARYNARAESARTLTDVVLTGDFAGETARPQPEYAARHLVFGNITVNVMSLTGEIKSFDMSNEPWPAPRTTADRLPGLEP